MRKRINTVHRNRRGVFLLALSFLLCILLRLTRNKCLRGATGKFVNGNAESECLKRICTKEPFTWMRWGDGETLYLSNRNNSRLHSAFYVASHHPAIFLNVATWWFCGKHQKDLWNSFAYRDGRYYDYVYFNMGDPLSGKASFGWRHQVEECSRKVLAVIPEHLDNLPIFKNAHTQIFRSPSNVGLNQGIKAISHVLTNLEEPHVVVIADGPLTKMIAAELTLTHPEHTYIDIGSALDGYAGVFSRDYNDPKKYCQQVKSKEEREKWFAPGVCT